MNGDGTRWGLASLLMTASIVLSALFLTNSDITSGQDADMADGTDAFPIQQKWQDICNLTTSYTLNRKVMEWTEEHLYFVYIKEDDIKGLAPFITRSDDNGTTWDDPQRLYNWTDCYEMKTGLVIHDGSIMVFISVSLERDWTTWSLHSIMIDQAEYGNESTYIADRLDDEYPGYMSFWNPVVFNDEVYIFWVRSHYLEVMYRIHNGNRWGKTIALDTGTHISNFVPFPTNITGTPKMVFIYQYYAEYKMYSIETQDGVKWTSPFMIHRISDGPNRFTMVEKDGVIHMAMSERDDLDIFYSNTTDGRNWSTLKGIGKGSTVHDPMKRPYLTNIHITYSDTTDTILVAYEHDKGIVVKESEDNGNTFNGGYYVNDTKWGMYPYFDPKGVFLMHFDYEHNLYIRAINISKNVDNVTDPEDNSTKPPDDDNQTGGNSTTPPDNNNTGPSDEPGDDTSGDPSNGIPNEDPDEKRNETDEDNDTGPILWAIEGQIGSLNITENGTIYCLKAPDIEYYHGTLNFTWFIGDRILYGKEIWSDMEPGDTEVVLRITDQDGNFIEKRSTINVPNPDDRPVLYPILFILFLSVMIIILIVSSSLILRRRFMARSRFEDSPQRESDDEVRSGILMDPYDVTEKVHNQTLNGYIDESMRRDIHNDTILRKDQLRDKVRKNYRDGVIDRETFFMLDDILNPK